MRSLTTALALLLGVLAMHAVSGGPHSPRGAEHSMAAPVAATMAAADDMAGMVEQAPVAAAGFVSAALASAVPRASDLPVDVPGAMAAMCVALLLSVALLLGHRSLGRAPAARRLLIPGRRLPRLDGLLRAPPPDLLALKCVLRT